MIKSKKVRPKILAWMPPEASKRQQTLNAVYVPFQPGHPLPIMVQLETQIKGSMQGLLQRATPEERHDLMVRLDLLGLLPIEAQEPGLTLAELALQLTEGNPELMVYLRPGRVEKLEEVPGASELLESLTLPEWMEALEAEVTE